MRTEPVLKPYERQLEKWLPNAQVQAATGAAAVELRWRGPQKTVVYAVECKPNLAHQDVRVVAEQLQHRRRQLRGHAVRLMVWAPFIRREQGGVLEQHQIDYVDLAGNAHLRAPGLFVHVEGLRPTTKPPRARHHMTRGWAKTVLALLVRPDLIKQPYRPIAEIAGVAPATVMTCLADLTTAGFVRRAKRTRHLANARELVALWIQAYADVLRPKLVQRNFQIRIPNKAERWHRLREVLVKHDVPWALTGADAALDRKSVV